MKRIFKSIWSFLLTIAEARAKSIAAKKQFYGY